MIRDIKIRITTDGRGKITSGKKSDKGFPQSLDYFDVSDFSELLTIYGEKPEKIVIFFPTDNIADFYDCNYVKWSKKEGKEGVKVRQCDGEECQHRIAETFGGKKFEAGDMSECICKSLPEDSEEKKHECKYHCYFKAYIADPTLGKVNNPSCYWFETGSKNSGDAIYSEIEKIRTLNMGVIRNVPFILSLKMVGGKENAKIKFPIWALQAVGMLSEIRERTEMLIGKVEGLKQIEAPAEPKSEKKTQAKESKKVEEHKPETKAEERKEAEPNLSGQSAQYFEIRAYINRSKTYTDLLNNWLAFKDDINTLPENEKNLLTKLKDDLKKTLK